jgi:cation transport protein ChaC
VLGLDEGGACRGVVFRVEPKRRDETLAYLREREQVTDVYVETHKPVSLLDGSDREVEALCYVVDRKHPQYAGQLSIETQARLVRSAAGRSGANIDYVLNTVRHLEQAGIHDVELAALAARLVGE